MEGTMKNIISRNFDWKSGHVAMKCIFCRFGIGLVTNLISFSCGTYGLRPKWCKFRLLK